ncbi:MAG: SGNH/GDSL hydrolase family protein [Burkholderiales bacterium]|nr:SGNH/GDSL hydrolase family protein [Burkholderiales bacterium]
MLLKLALGPLLIWQGRQVRRVAMKLPEAAGPRQGVAGEGAPQLRLLVVGDSSAAGVGVADQQQALAAPLAGALSKHLGVAVGWQLLATTGHTAADAVRALQDATSLQAADVMVTALGVNDAVAQVRPATFLRQLDALHTLARQRAGVRYTLHSGLPPVSEFPLLPQPLRAMLGRDAQRLDMALSRHLEGRPDQACAPLPVPPLGANVADWIAVDGFHPGPLAYRAWAEALAARLALHLQVSASAR